MNRILSILEACVKNIFVRYFGLSNKCYWYPRGEKPLRVKDMPNSHLLNACRKLEPTVLRWATLNKEIHHRGLRPLQLKTIPMSEKIVEQLAIDFIDDEVDFF